jgi:hypothetical protein
MATETIRQTQHICDGCGKKAIGKEKPVDWTVFNTALNLGSGDYSKGIDLCANCSKEPETAAQRYKNGITTT